MQCSSVNIIALLFFFRHSAKEYVTRKSLEQYIHSQYRCKDVATMWNLRSAEVCARFVSKHWILIRRVFNVLRSKSGDSKNMMMWLSPLLIRLGNVCTSLLRCVQNTNVVSKVAREFLEFVLSMYNIVADESLLNSAADVVELMGRNIAHALPSFVEAVFPSTSKHLKQGGGPDGVPAICTWWKLSSAPRTLNTITNTLQTTTR